MRGRMARSTLASKSTSPAPAYRQCRSERLGAGFLLIACRTAHYSLQTASRLSKEVENSMEMMLQNQATRRKNPPGSHCRHHLTAYQDYCHFRPLRFRLTIRTE